MRQWKGTSQANCCESITLLCVKALLPCVTVPHVHMHMHTPAVHITCTHLLYTSHANSMHNTYKHTCAYVTHHITLPHTHTHTHTHTHAHTHTNSYQVTLLDQKTSLNVNIFLKQFKRYSTKPSVPLFNPLT